MRDIVGVNGIDPARQGIKTRSIVLKDQGIEKRSIVVLKNGRSWFRLNKIVQIEQGGSIESLANRVNAIRPYDILRHRSHPIA